MGKKVNKMKIIEKLENLENSSSFHKIDRNSFEILKNLNILPTFKREEENYALIRDIKIISLARINKVAQKTMFEDTKLIEDLPLEYSLQPGYETEIIFPYTNLYSLPPEFYASCKNIIMKCNRKDKNIRSYYREQPYFDSVIMMSKYPALLEIANSQIARAQNIRGDLSMTFANTAYYMGSKKALGPFLVESLYNILNKDDIVLDIMCGSGSASKALSYYWKTIASDGLEFCINLAHALGSGYSIRKANETLDKLLPNITKNLMQLTTQLSTLLTEEEEFAHSELTIKKRIEYINFVNKTPHYPDGNTHDNWYPNDFIIERQNNRKIEPYCLVTAYFSNVYFGIRQSIEIDSIRYAIDQLRDGEEKTFAIAALIATCSQLGTGYASQFAQPKTLIPEQVPNIIEIRSQNILHEFCIRLVALAKESEKAPYKIKTIRGKWQDVLERVTSWEYDHPTVVYLDAPYTRDEYSRYYHVLETIVKYNYPSSHGKGRSPDRNHDEYFKSPFFTKKLENIIDEFVEIITTVINLNIICAWSYSNQAVINIVDVIERVSQKVSTDIISYSTPYRYKAQGGKKAKETIEYCIIFIPKEISKKRKLFTILNKTNNKGNSFSRKKRKYERDER